MQSPIVIVGAGLAGLVCARELVASGRDVVVLDKGRRPGGRSCSHRDAAGRMFDHGAQFFTAHDPWTAARVEEWQRAGVVAPWHPRGAREDHAPWWVGTPSMGALAEHLAEGLRVERSTHVTRVLNTEGSWRVETRGTLHEAATLVLAIPGPQAAALLGPLAPPSEMDACWAAMVRLGGSSTVDMLETKDGPFSWAAREGSKPGRLSDADEDRWTVHASPEWSAAHLEASAEVVARSLAETLCDALPNTRVLEAHAHRWRYAKPRVDNPVGAHVNTAERVVVCGDWLQSPRIEGALLSGRAAARRITEMR